jgi:predicted ABC-type ATPase
VPAWQLPDGELTAALLSTHTTVSGTPPNRSLPQGHALPETGRTGNEQSKLIVLRGNSGSGKSSLAAALRTRLGRGTALVQQDVLRRTVLREQDVAGGANIGLISMTARYALDHGYDVILEGILSTAHYADMVRALAHDHRGVTAFYYLDIPFAETVNRHATRPQHAHFSADDMRDWYRPQDLLADLNERIITETSTLESTVSRILGEVFPERG